MLSIAWKQIGFATIFVCTSLVVLSSFLGLDTVPIPDWRGYPPNFPAGVAEKYGLIDGKRPVEFYKNELLKSISGQDEPVNFTVQFQKLDNVDMLSAFEFEFEYFVVFSTKGAFGGRMFCHYFDGDGKEFGEPFESFVFPDFAVFCPPREGTTKPKMALTVDGKVKPSFTVPLLPKPETGDPKHYLSVCLATVYGDEPKWLMLIELIEHYKLQGATFFYVYVQKIDEYSQRVLQYYTRSGELEVIYLFDNHNFDPKEWQVPVNRDCGFRTRGRSHWTVFADLDERLTTVSGPATLVDHLRKISDKTIGALQFRQRWVLKKESMPSTYTDSQQVLEWMPSTRFTNTSSYGPQGHTAKCIVDTNKAYSMWVHWVDKFYPGYRLVQMDPKLGYVRHYRDIRMDDWGRRWLKGVEDFGPFEPTDYQPTHLLTKLQRDVMSRSEEIYGELRRVSQEAPFRPP